MKVCSFPPPQERGAHLKEGPQHSVPEHPHDGEVGRKHIVHMRGGQQAASPLRSRW